MWVDEAIWGHRLYDEQTPWMVLLEFLNVFHFESSKGRALSEPDGPNKLTYKAAKRLHLRNILFNNPHLAEIRIRVPHDVNRWEQWLRKMAAATGLNFPKFEYLQQRFDKFDDFCDVVSLVR